MIEAAYHLGHSVGLEVWCEDEAGPFPTMPIPGASWQAVGQPATYPHEYVRDGTAKLLTLLRPRDGQVRVKGVTHTTNEVLHPWLKQELAQILATLPEQPPTLTVPQQRDAWTRWQDGLSLRITLPAELPPLRLLLILDNLAGHKTPEFVLWCYQQGIMLLYTPLGGSWLNMAESIQRILKRRALEGEHPHSPDQIIEWLEAAAAGWNCHPTPFVWGGKRATRRARARGRRHAAPGSAAYTRKPLRPQRSLLEEWRRADRMTH